MSVVLSHSVLGQFFMQQWNTNINMKKVLFASSFLYALLIFYLVFCMKMPKSDSWISSRCVCVCLRYLGIIGTPVLKKELGSFR